MKVKFILYFLLRYKNLADIQKIIFYILKQGSKKIYILNQQRNKELYLKIIQWYFYILTVLQTLGCMLCISYLHLTMICQIYILKSAIKNEFAQKYLDTNS